MNEILKIDKLHKNYKNFELKEVSFALPEGAVMGMVGKNGAGKTTIIKAILNTVKYNGDIYLFGEKISAQNIKLRQDIGIVFDDLYFADFFRAIEINNIMKRIYDKWNEELFYEYIERFDIDKNKKLKKYSRGMKTKLSIAAALSHEARLLLLDEPMLGLDPIARDDVYEILLEFIENGRNSVMLSTHITDGLDKIADYITFINDGRLVFSEQNDYIAENLGVVRCSENEFKGLEKRTVLRYRRGKLGYEALINNKGSLSSLPVDETDISEIMLFYIKGERL